MRILFLICLILTACSPVQKKESNLEPIEVPATSTLQEEVTQQIQPVPIIVNCPDRRFGAWEIIDEGHEWNALNSSTMQWEKVMKGPCSYERKNKN